MFQGELRKRVEEHNRKMREARKPLPKSDYERQLLKAVKAQPAKKKAGKGVPCWVFLTSLPKVDLAF